MKGNFRWAAVFVIFCAVCAAIWFVRGNGGGSSAVIRQNGKVIKRINLSEVTSPYEFTVTAENGGSNTVRVEKGRIAVIDADCPDRICVRRGYIKNSAAPIVCLPHRLSITVTNENAADIDAAAGSDIASGS